MLGRVQRNLRWARVLARAGLPGRLRAYAAYRGIRWPGGAAWAVCFSFDIDYEEDERAVPDVLAALSKRGIHASFACVGAHASRRPGPYREIAAWGHEVVNHSMTHPHHPELSPSRHWNELSQEQVREEISRAQEVLDSIAGTRVLGFRAPHFERNAAQAEVLASLGYAYDSSGLHAELEPGDGLPLFDGRIPEVPIHRSASTWRHFRAKEARPEEWGRAADAILDREQSRGGLAVFYFDPQDIARVPEAFGRLLDRAKGEGAWVGGLLDVVRHLEALS